jgi:phage terminase large subunit
MDEIRQILASLLRGEDNDRAKVFYSYNPPPSKNNWVNKEMHTKRYDRLIHRSTYLKAPKKWLGRIFLDEADQLKKANQRKYDHMYLGLEIGEGLEIYNNLEVRTITNTEIQKMDMINRGLDFGYSHASCYVESFFDRLNDIVYVIDEIYGYKMNNRQLYDSIIQKAYTANIIADSEDPRTINELKMMGLNISGAKKGKDSKPHGIKWLSDRVKIVIDRKRCPNIAADLECYEKEKDKEGNIIEAYPDEPDGSASLRYSLERFIINKRLGWKD